jgi:hypothetical protein
MHRHFCEKCWDTGKVGFFRKKTCPKCNGEPKKTWKESHPRPGKVLPIKSWPKPKYRIPPTPPPSRHLKEGEQPKKNFNHEIIDNNYYCRSIDKESVNRFVELVEEKAEQKMLITEKLEGAHYTAMKEIQKEINGE